MILEKKVGCDSSCSHSAYMYFRVASTIVLQRKPFALRVKFLLCKCGVLHI